MAAPMHEYEITTPRGHEKVTAANFAEQGRWVIFVDAENDPVLTMAIEDVRLIRRCAPVADAPAESKVEAA